MVGVDAMSAEARRTLYTILDSRRRIQRGWASSILLTYINEARRKLTHHEVCAPRGRLHCMCPAQQTHRFLSALHPARRSPEAILPFGETGMAS